MLNEADLEGMIRTWITDKGVEVISDSDKGWSEFAEFIDYLGHLHDDVLQPGAATMSTKELHRMGQILDEQITNLTKRVTLNPQGTITMFHLYGDNRSVNPAYNLYKRGEDILARAIVLKLLGLLRPDLDFTAIKNKQRVLHDHKKGVKVTAY